ncbi:MAG TPA: LytR family transcriptional regulator, partial [Chloroflexi bacterium]|nr:LytR family transcriptional regulator [Chloroflexota bacterium]
MIPAKHLLQIVTTSLFLVLIFSLMGCSANAQTLPTLAPTVVGMKRISQPTNPPAAEPTETPTSPPTDTPTPAGSPTPGPSPTPTATVPTPTDTPIPSATPTSKPTTVPILTATAAPPFLEGIPTPPTAVPTAVPTFAVSDDFTNILLLGSDTPLDEGGTRTDTMIIVSVNNDTGTASVISLPRDLYVYHPGKTMSRLNTALSFGDGVDLLKQTILYNFGIPIHYYARVDFDGFKTAVDAMDGVDVAVSCQLRDWRLKSPELDPEDEDNWEIYTMEPGVYHMDGDTALWYARSRRTTSDFDRGRRQQQILQAMLNEGVDLGLVSQFPALWNTYRDNVDTDMDIGRALQLAALAPTIRENGVQHLYLARGTTSWTTPEGAQVQLPVWEGKGNMQETFSRLFRAPTLNKATRRPVYVEIVNATDNPDLAQLAADNLAWYGFIPIIAKDDPQPGSVTQLQYFRPNFKDSYDWLISWIFDIRRSQIELVEDDDFAYDYRVILGEDYDPCLNKLYQPQEFI